MPRRLQHDASGNFAIYDSENPNALTDPVNNLDSVYFHADLDYLQIVYDESVNFTFPARGAGAGQATHDIFPAHNLGFIPYGVLLISGKQRPAFHFLQGVFDDIRCVALRLDNPKVYIRETWANDDGNDTGSTSRTLRVILYRIAPAGASPGKLFHFIPAQNRLLAGEGKFDTNNKYLRRTTTTPDFWMAKGRTIDTYRRGMKQVLPDGTVDYINETSYSGSFAGEGFWGVRD